MFDYFECLIKAFQKLPWKLQETMKYSLSFKEKFHAAFQSSMEIFLLARARSNNVRRPILIFHGSS